MFLIVGLGNPGTKYTKTRHNMGFDTIDCLIDKYSIAQEGVKFNAMYGKGMIGGQKVLVMKPLSYMNLSGTPIQEMLHFYKIDPETEMIVVYDDIDLDPGVLRIRKKGSAGGHNGIKDIIAKTGTQNFARVRVGVGKKPQGWDLADYVLSRFGTEERKEIDEGIERAAQAVALMVEQGVDAAMNQFNGKKK